MTISIIPATRAHVPHIEFADPAYLEMLIEDPHTVSLLALKETQVVAYGCTWLSPVHKKRRWLDLTVHPSYRLHGVGLQMFEALSAGADRPFAARLIAGTSAELFAQRLGGTIYQSCVRPQLAGDHLAHTATAWGEHPGVEVISGRQLGTEDLHQVWFEQYNWIHHVWSPLDTSEEGTARLRAEAELLDIDMTSIAIDEGVPLAACLVFADEQAPTFIAETVTGLHPEGRDLVRAVIGTSAKLAHEAGIQTVEFDGHVGDPHFGPVSQEMTLTGAQALLYEIPPAS